MKRVMYVSRTTRKPTKGELADILAGSRLRNAKHEITGILVYDRGYFAQILEGPVEAVDQLLRNIAGDPRHDEYMLVSEGSIEERYFGGWEMDWADLEEVTTSDHAELRGYLRSRSVEDRSAIYGALIAFMEDHASAAGYSDDLPQWPEYQENEDGVQYIELD